MNNERTEPVTGAVFTINMFAGTDFDDCFTEKEVHDMCLSAGFKNVSKVPLDGGISRMNAVNVQNLS